MDCAQFIETYSDYLDRRLEACSLFEYREHLRRCRSCATYDRVVRRGLNLIQELEPPEPQRDVSTRVRSGVFDFQEEFQQGASSWSRAATLALTAATVLFVATSLPIVSGGADPVQLPPVVVEEPSSPAFPLSLWGRPPDLQPTISLFVAPSLSSGSALARPSERFSLFRAPLRVPPPRSLGEPPATREERAE